MVYIGIFEWPRRAAGIIWYTKSISNSPTNIDMAELPKNGVQMLLKLSS